MPPFWVRKVDLEMLHLHNQELCLVNVEPQPMMDDILTADKVRRNWPKLSSILMNFVTNDAHQAAQMATLVHTARDHPLGVESRGQNELTLMMP